MSDSQRREWLEHLKEFVFRKTPADSPEYAAKEFAEETAKQMLSLMESRLAFFCEEHPSKDRD